MLIIINIEMLLHMLQLCSWITTMHIVFFLAFDRSWATGRWERLRSPSRRGSNHSGGKESTHQRSAEGSYAWPTLLSALLSKNLSVQCNYRHVCVIVISDDQSLYNYLSLICRSFNLFIIKSFQKFQVRCYSEALPTTALMLSQS